MGLLNTHKAFLTHHFSSTIWLVFAEYMCYFLSLCDTLIIFFGLQQRTINKHLKIVQTTFLIVSNHLLTFMNSSKTPQIALYLLHHL